MIGFNKYLLVIGLILSDITRGIKSRLTMPPKVNLAARLNKIGEEQSVTVPC